jgi:orotidine-5'-phosphate decarboxylase
MVTTHSICGTDALVALDQEATKRNMGIIVVVQLSCKGNLIDSKYTQSTLDILPKLKSLVGVVSQQRYANFTTFSPGVSLTATQDDKGQQYRSPHQIDADFLIIGRAITASPNPAAAAQAHNKISPSFISRL